MCKLNRFLIFSLLIISLFEINSRFNKVYSAEKARISFEISWEEFGNSRALQRYKEAKIGFAYLNLIPWIWVCGQDVDHTKKVEPEGFLWETQRLNFLYNNNIQTIARIFGVHNTVRDKYPSKMKNLTYDQFRESWLENYAKPLIQSLYEHGIYIIDLTTEFGWFDNSFRGPFGPFRDDDSYHPFTNEGDVVYDPNLTVGEFKQKYHNTMRELYEWKNKNFPKIIFTCSLHVACTVEDTDKLMMYVKDCIDWVGEDVTSQINRNGLDPDYQGTWEKHYLYNWCPIIENLLTTVWGTAVLESYAWKSGPEDYFGPPGSPYEESFCYSGTSFQDALEKVVELDGVNKYLKFFIYSRWVARFVHIYQKNNPCTPLSYANDLGTLPPWDPADLPFPHSVTTAYVYNRWGDTEPHPSNDAEFSSFAYIRDVMHADSNTYWDNNPPTQLLIRCEDIVILPSENKVRLKLRNLCAQNGISSNIHIYQTPNDVTPWDCSAYIKATPENIKNSLQDIYEVAFVSAGSYSVPGNGNLDTENNVVELEVSSSAPLTDGKNIYVYIEDSDTVKGWTAFNDVPECTNLEIEGKGYHKFDFHSPGISGGYIYLRARAKDIFGSYSSYTVPLQVEKQYKLSLTCDAFDNDGISRIEYQYSNDGIIWYDVPFQNYYCLTANDKEFKRNSRYMSETTDLGHYPIIESIEANPVSGVAPLSVDFQVVAYDPVAEITSIAWDFDRDGTIDATGETASWTYTDPGAYQALVKVTNDEEKESFICIGIEVLEGTPIASIKATPKAGTVPLTVQFEGSGADHDGTIIKYEWDFTSDGTIDTTIQNPSYTYTSINNYTVSLTVTDNDNKTDTATLKINVTDPDRISSCSVIASTTEGEVPLTINFSADISGGTVSSYEWDFNNDGNVDSTEEAPSFTYTTSGLFTSQLTVTDILGYQKTDYEYITVKAAGLPSADFSFTPDGGVTPLEMNFQPEVSDPDGTIVSWEWDFGDCSYSAEEVPPPHLYTMANKYLVRLTVTDNDGNKVTARKYVDIYSGFKKKLYGDGNTCQDIAVNQDMLTGGYYTYSVDPDEFGEECGKSDTSIYFRGQDGNEGGSGISNAHGDLTDGNFGFVEDEGVMWSAGKNPEIVFNLIEKYALNNIEIWQDPVYDFETVTCYISQDGISWGEIGIFDIDGIQNIHLDLINNSAKSIKLSFKNSDPSSKAFLTEVQIWGTPFEESLMDWVDDFEYSGLPQENNWSIYTGNGELSVEYDDFLKGNVLKITSSEGTNFGIRKKLTNNPDETYAKLEKRYLSYTIKSTNQVQLYVLLRNEDNDWRYLVYRFSEETGYTINGQYIYYNLPIVYKGNQNWNTISRDLEDDLFKATGKHLKNIGLVLIRGGGYWLDNLTFSSSPPSTLGWGLRKDTVLSANGSMLKVMDHEIGKEVIKVYSTESGNLFFIRSEFESYPDSKWVRFSFKTNRHLGFYFLVKGSDNGWYYIDYQTATGDYAISDIPGCRCVYHYLGEDYKSGKWVDVYRDLDRDLYVGYGVHLKEVAFVLIRGRDFYLKSVELSENPFEKLNVPLNYGWHPYKGTGTVESIYDTDLQSQVMKVNSSEGFGFGITGPETAAGHLNVHAKYLSFMIKPEHKTWLYLFVQGEDNANYEICYQTDNGEYTINGNRITHYLGSDLINSKWHSIMRNLNSDLQKGFGVNVKKVFCFSIAGGGYSLDNLTLYGENPQKIIVSLAASDWYSYDTPPYSGDGEFSNYFDQDIQTQVLKIYSVSENWYSLSLFPDSGLPYLDISKKSAKLTLKSYREVGIRFYVRDHNDNLYEVVYITGEGTDSVVGNTANIYLGSLYKDGNWHEAIFSLEKDLYEKFNQHLQEIIQLGIHGGDVEICNFKFLN
ncbi:MAG: PKD domain-containing protein [bacterium]